MDLLRRTGTTAACLLAGAGIALLATTPAAAQEPDDGEAYVVDVVAEDYAFDAPDEIPSGWVTFRFENAGNETHFIFLTRLPDGRTNDEYVRDVGTIFTDVWEDLKARKIFPPGAAERLNEEIPEWYWSAEQMGGVGMIAPGRTAEATLRLRPGTYHMECYMKTPEGLFHANEGMEHPLVVTEESSGAPEPEANASIRLVNYGMELEGELRPGRNTVAVHYEAQPENAFGHDVHVARVEAPGMTDVVLPWLSWLNIHGMESPAPMEFVGGVHDMPVGTTAYFTLDLEPGSYLFLSEETAPRGVMKEVTIEE